MPGNTKKRRRKGRGTQGGRPSTRPAGRPRNRAEARQRAQQRRAAARGGKSRGKEVAGAPTTRSGRVPQEPSWKGAIQKGVLASLLFFALFAFLFQRPIGASAALAAFTLAFYVPLSYYLDSFMYRRYQRNLQRDRERAAAAKQSPADGGDDSG